jgi:nucleoside-diphosphate-sugar epimerase
MVATNGHRAIVTGFPGWLGNRLVHFLRHPHPDWPEEVPRPAFDGIRCLVLPGTEVPDADLEVVEGDIRDPCALRRLFVGAEGAVVFHLAAVIHPRRPSECFAVNTEGTRRLLAEAVRAGARRVVATSSNSPAGGSRDPGHVLDESSPYRPYMAYGRSKKLMEEHVRAAHRSGALETVVIRPCWFYGPHQPPRQSIFLKMVRRGRAPIVGGGGNRRSLSYVDNTSLGLLLAATREEAAGETYWIADRRPYTVNEIVDTVEDLFETEFRMEVAHQRLRLPSVASDVAVRAAGAIQVLGLHSPRAQVLGEMNKTIACSVEKARRELRYEPSVELREGMRRSIGWCLETGQDI